MTEETELNLELATSWVRALMARGVTVLVRNNRIWFHLHGRPSSAAFSELSDDELLFLRHNREAIKAVVRAGLPADDVAPSATQPVPPVSRAVERTAGVPRESSPTVAPAPISPEVLRIIHGNRPEEIERRNREATAVMLHRVGKPHPWDD
jgi:hypothetical protein